MSGFFIWKRSDGYVSASTFMPPNHPNITFEELGFFESFTKECCQFIDNERAKSPYHTKFDAPTKTQDEK